MIRIYPDTLVLLYLATTLAVLLSLWLYHNYRSRRKNLFLADKTLYHCEYCLSAYLENPGKTITQCPICNSYNRVN